MGGRRNEKPGTVGTERESFLMKMPGYTSGVVIAIGAVALSVYAGVQYGRATAPEPCIANYHSTTHPWFADREQEWLEDTTPYSSDNTVADSPRDFVYHLVDMMQDEAQPGEQTLRVHVSHYDDKEYIVPANCYVGEITYFGEPVLYWGNEPDATEFKQSLF